MSSDINEEVINQILNEEVVFYTDKDNPSQIYVDYPLATGATCFAPVKTGRFEAFISHRYRELADEPLCPPDVFHYLEAKKDTVLYKQPNPVTIHRRVAGTLAGKILYFLADEKWQSVLVAPNGWSVGQSKKTKFMKYPADKPQVKPVGGGNLLALLRPFVNLPDDDFILFTAFLVQSFSRSSSHYAAIVSSNKGTGKSTLTKMIRSIVDPSTSETSLTPSSENDLKTMLANTYLACFDNTAPLSAKYSDILCAAITGSKDVKRKLYSNCDQIILNLHNLVVINGIDIVPHRSDLADRSLLFELRPIPKTGRIADSDFWRDFEAKKAHIIGAIFDTLVNAMGVLPTLTFETLERMADAHKEMTAIAVALGIEQEEFQRIFNQSKDRLQDAYNQTNELVELVVDYMRTHRSVDLPVSKLYEELRESIKGSGKFFPDNPSVLSRKLNLEKDALYAAGYNFSKKRVGGYNHIVISHIPKNQQTKVHRDYQQRKSLLAEDDASIEN